MNQFLPITEYITYMLFSYLTGYTVLQFIPEKMKPKIKTSKQSLLLSVLAIIILTFMPVLQVISYLSPDGIFSLASYSILTEFQIGIAWLYGSFFAVFLWMVLYVEGPKYLQCIFLLLMIISVGYASHASSLNLWIGLLTHTTHFLTITTWVGILLHVSWIANRIENWTLFLKWFTPLSIFLFLTATISGISLMFLAVEPSDYVNSWVLPYGQMLLIKHLSIIPILAFALINSYLSKKTTLTPNVNIKLWIQAETVILMFVFFVTGILGTSAPPHQVNATVIQDGAAEWVVFLIGQEIAAPLKVEFFSGFHGILLFIIAALFLALIFISFLKKASSWIALVFAFLFIISAYLGIMLSIVIK